MNLRPGHLALVWCGAVKEAQNPHEAAAKLKTWSPEEHNRYERLWQEEQAAFAKDQAFRSPELPTREAMLAFREWRYQVKERPKMEQAAAHFRQLYQARKAATGTTAPPPPQGGAANA